MNNVFISDRFESFLTCKQKYYFKYIQGVKLPEKQEHFELGKDIHALANYHLNGQDVSVLEKNLSFEALKHWQTLKNSDVLKFKPFLTEWGFDCRLADTNFWLNGRIDAIFKDPANEKYLILDWKTGQNIPRNHEDSFQAQMYLYAFFKAQKDLKIEFKESKLEFIFFKTIDSEQKKILFSDDKNKKIEANLINCAEKIIEFEKNPQISEEIDNKKCKFCNFKSVCQLQVKN